MDACQPGEHDWAYDETGGEADNHYYYIYCKKSVVTA